MPSFQQPAAHQLCLLRNAVAERSLQSSSLSWRKELNHWTMQVPFHSSLLLKKTKYTFESFDHSCGSKMVEKKNVNSLATNCPDR